MDLNFLSCLSQLVASNLIFILISRFIRHVLDEYRWND